MFPPDPVSSALPLIGFHQPDLQQHFSEQELLTYHAEVLALQDTFGISYKDASHRLYMASLEKLKVSQASYKAFKNLDTRLKKYLVDLPKRFGPKDVKANVEMAEDVEIAAEVASGADLNIGADISIGAEMDTS
jgi:hypothetical protein